MTARSANHSTIVLERTYDASPSRVFAAWSDPEALLRWGSPGEDWDMSFDRFEFRVGGGDVTRFGPAGGPVYFNRTRYEDILQDERIVSTGQMTEGDKLLFVGVLTLEFHPAGSGCRMVMTEQGVFLDGQDVPENHQAGWSHMLDQLGDELDRGRAAA
ncbi:SRPBCC family protein [Arvimicrobium flavum]|uniref:SRPBCC family protein n=1 Tax=Arvimicrobium flavum TaxID=3393320 RepID=UPI00237A0BAA|nr:SRPBCC family protein [Mesorhizobium shangrilense]